MSGGTFGAEASTLAIMVGGQKDVCQRAEPILRAMEKNAFHCGELGAGDVVTVVNNVLDRIATVFRDLAQRTAYPT